MHGQAAENLGEIVAASHKLHFKDVSHIVLLQSPQCRHTNYTLMKEDEVNSAVGRAKFD